MSHVTPLTPLNLPFAEAPVRGHVVLTVEQARGVLNTMGWLKVPPCLTLGTLLRFAKQHHAALEATVDPGYWHGVPQLTFRGGLSVQWDGQVTHGRWVRLKAFGPNVEMSWDTGTGRPSVFIGRLLHEAGAVYVEPPVRESLGELRERLGLRAA